MMEGVQNLDESQSAAVQGDDDPGLAPNPRL